MTLMRHKLCGLVLASCFVISCGKDRQSTAPEKSQNLTAKSRATTDGFRDLRLVFPDFSQMKVETRADAAIALENTMGEKYELEPEGRFPLQEKMMNDIVARLHRALQLEHRDEVPAEPPRLFLVKSKADLKSPPNAFVSVDPDTVIPHWALFVSSNLVSNKSTLNIKNEADLAFVLAHEIGHITRMHAFREVRFNASQGDSDSLVQFFRLRELQRMNPFDATGSSGIAAALYANVSVKAACKQVDTSAVDKFIRLAKDWESTFLSRYPLVTTSFYLKTSEAQSIVSDHLQRSADAFSSVESCVDPISTEKFKRAAVSGLSILSALGLQDALTESEKPADVVKQFEAWSKAQVAKIDASGTLQTTESEADEIGYRLSFQAGFRTTQTVFSCEPLALTSSQIQRVPVWTAYGALRGDSLFFPTYVDDAHAINCYRNDLGSNIVEQLKAITSLKTLEASSSLVSSGGLFLSSQAQWNLVQDELTKQSE